MSMISAQIDELRDAANRGGLVVGLPEMLREAADTIWQLRDDLQRANAENAKLRELVRNFLYEHEDYFAEGNYFIGDIDLEHAMQHNHAVFRREARELGVEVDDA